MINVEAQLKQQITRGVHSRHWVDFELDVFRRGSILKSGQNQVWITRSGICQVVGSILNTSTQIISYKDCEKATCSFHDTFNTYQESSR